MQETITLVVAANEAEDLMVAIDLAAISLSEGSPIWVTLQELNVRLLEAAEARSPRADQRAPPPLN